MRKQYLFAILFLLIQIPCEASTYFGGNYGYSAYSSDVVEKNDLSLKGPTYGGFIGFGREFVGLEGFYQSFKTTGEVLHDDNKADFLNDVAAMGAALRFSFSHFYFRLGFASYKIKQSLKIDDSDSRDAANQIYDIQEDKKATGAVYGVGLHSRLGNSSRVFLDFSRYQITSVGYFNALTLGFSFKIDDRFFTFDRD